MIKLGQLVYRSQFSTIRQFCFDISYQTPFNPRFFGTIQTLKPYFEPLVVLKCNKSTDVSKNSTVSKRIKSKRYFSEEDDKYLAKLVKKHGYSWQTFKIGAKEMGRKHPSSVKLRFDEYIEKQYKVSGPFSPEEDKTILDQIEQHGKTPECLRDIAKELDRSLSSIENRSIRLLSSNEFETNPKKRDWELVDDEKLIEFVIKRKQIKTKDAISLEDVKLSDLTDIASEMKRSSSSCYNRWMSKIVPTLKAHMKNLPMTSEWKKDILHYIVKNKVKDKRDIDVDILLQDVAPGQTSQSLMIYLDSLKRETINGKAEYSENSLFECASKRLSEKRQNDPIFNENHKGELKRLEWCEEIITYYESIFHS